MTSSPLLSQSPRLMKCRLIEMVGPPVPAAHQSRDLCITIDDAVFAMALLLRPPLVIRQSDDKLRVVGNPEGFWYAQHRAGTEPRVSQDVWAILLPAHWVETEITEINQTLVPLLLNSVSTRDNRVLRRKLKKLKLNGVKMHGNQVRLAAVAKSVKR